jgi:beta-glucosidase
MALSARDLTLDEKASLLSGGDMWHTKAVDRVGLQAWMMCDGPHGLRKRSAGDESGLKHSAPATCFPSGAGLAASWNRGLLEEVAAAVGAEARAEDVGVVLGPAVNIKRSPLCGRNFEYFSEDPLLAGELAKAHIRGLQSRGVGASIKHFAANNQETRRLLSDSRVDERTLREIYLTAFEIAVKGARPWTVMCAYNRINGEYCSQNRKLLTDILRTEWGFDGLVMTDWGACDLRAAGVAAGQDLEMPASGGVNDRAVIAAVKSGELPEAAVDLAVDRSLALAAKVAAGAASPAPVFDREAHHALARRAAGECMVLLKNDGALLPLDPDRPVAFIGAFAESPRYQGGGSSHINPTRVENAREAAQAIAPGKVSYAPGYGPDGEAIDAALLAEARRTAAAAEAAVVFIGLTDRIESEGFDRTDLRLPESQLALLRAVAEVQPRVAVVLSNGAPVEMPWLDTVPAVLEAYLGGQASGGAVADLLFGRTNPSGKLAETFPLRLEDTPTYLDFAGPGDAVEYREGVFVGYRWYDARRLPVLFPFGHGLSYTDFAYGGLSADKPVFAAGGTLSVSLEIANTGGRPGQEIVQLYVRPIAPARVRPVQELKGFAKLELGVGESRRAGFELDDRAFARWGDQGWEIDPGEYELAAGASSRDLRSFLRIRVDAPRPAKRWTRYDCLGPVLDDPRYADFLKPLAERFNAVFGYTDRSRPEWRMIQAMLAESPLRTLASFGAAADLDSLIAELQAVEDGRPAPLRP